MIGNYFKVAFRNLSRHRYYTAIHIVGLGVAIASALFIYRYITFHLSYDAYHPDASHTYKVVSDLDLEETSYNEGVSYAIYDALKSRVAGVDRVAYSMRRQAVTVTAQGQVFDITDAAFASSGWFKLFTYRWLSGSADALERPGTVALTTSTARRLFGKEDPMGKTLLVEGTTPMEVVGLMDDEPSNTSLKSTLFISESSMRSVLPGLDEGFFTYWGYLMGSNDVFVSLPSATAPEAVEKVLNSMTVEKFGEEMGRKYNFKLLPLSRLHFDQRYGGTVQQSLLVTLGGIGAAILFMALLNYINLSLAQYARRSAEIGTRKVLGSSQGQLFSQFMVESLTLSGLATLMGAALLFAAFPLANTWLFLEEPLTPYPAGQLLLVGGIAWLAISFLAGIYPSAVITRLRILPAMKQQVPFGTSAGRKVMVVIQNVLSQSLIIATVIMMVQVHFLRSTDVGFDRESVLMLRLPREVKAGQWRAFLNAQPGVSSYSFCFRSPANHDQRGGTLLYDHRPDWETWSAKSTFADSAYLQTFGIRLLAGRNLRTDGASAEYLINETMARQLEAGAPTKVLGKTLLYGGMYDDKPGVIVGIVNDYNTHSLHQSIQPTVLGYSPDLIKSLAIKVNSSQVAGFIHKLNGEWKARYPDERLNYQFTDARIDQLYASEQVQQRLVWVASAVAILIGCLGLLGLISLSVLQRTKEIGIRKTLGASVSGIVSLLAGDFVRLVLIALVIACPLAGWAMNRWLQDFAYRVDMEWWMFAAAGLAALGIALITVSGQAIRAALANPVKSLRTE